MNNCTSSTTRAKKNVVKLFSVELLCEIFQESLFYIKMLIIRFILINFFFLFYFLCFVNRSNVYYVIGVLYNSSIQMVLELMHKI